MSVAVAFANLDQVVANLNTWTGNKQIQINLRIQEAGINVQSQAKRACPVGTPESTGIKKYHGGRLRQSIQYVPGKMECSVGSDVYYAKFVNNGTVKMKARPFLTNAFIGEKKQLIADLEAIVTS